MDFSEGNTSWIVLALVRNFTRLPSKCAPMDRNRLSTSGHSQRLEEEWRVAIAIFNAYQKAKPQVKIHYLGLLFEHISPFIRRALRSVEERSFFILSPNWYVPELMEKLSSNIRIAQSPEAFELWVEKVIQEYLLGLAQFETRDGPGEDEETLALFAFQNRFNRMGYEQRFVVYQYCAQGQSLESMAGLLEESCDELKTRLHIAWMILTRAGQRVRIPTDWRIPDSCRESDI